MTQYFLALAMLVQQPQQPTVPVVEPPKVVRKIKIKHASPLFIWIMLHGNTNFNLPPEPKK